MASDIHSDSLQFLETVHLCSNNRELIEVYKEAFSHSRYAKLVLIEEIDFVKLEVPLYSSLVVPGDSFGFLSPQNAIHSKAIDLYGENLQEKITSTIYHKKNGELLVGESILLSTPSQTQHIVYAPSHRVHGSNENRMSVFLSVRAALQRIRKFNLKTDSYKINRLIISDTCALYQQIPLIRLAMQTKVAVDAILLNLCPIFQMPTSLPRPLSLEVSLSKLKHSSELNSNSYLANCML